MRKSHSDIYDKRRHSFSSIENLWASRCEKSEEKGQRQKVNLLCLNMKENMATGHMSRFFASLLFFLGFFLTILGLGKKIKKFNLFIFSLFFL